MIELTTHIVIPDTQAAPGNPVKHLEWIGQYIVDEFAGKPAKVIHLGDHWDMPSLSAYDRGTSRIEGKRYVDDIDAGNAAFKLLTDPLEAYNRRRKPENQWHPQRHLLLGNHENRITRAAEDNAQLDGAVSLRHLDTDGFKVHPFLVPVTLDGVVYAHYFYAPLTGRAYGGGTIENRLKQVGHTFTQGHQQTLMYGLRFVNGRSQHGLIAGACYLHDEDYKGPQGNSHWRGIIICHQVENGSYDPMFVSLDYLSRRYEGKRLVRSDYL